MSTMFVTITWIHCYYRYKPFEIGRVARLTKEHNVITTLSVWNCRLSKVIKTSRTEREFLRLCSKHRRELLWGTKDIAGKVCLAR